MFCEVHLGQSEWFAVFNVSKEPRTGAWQEPDIIMPIKGPYVMHGVNLICTLAVSGSVLLINLDYRFMTFATNPCRSPALPYNV